VLKLVVRKDEMSETLLHTFHDRKHSYRSGPKKLSIAITFLALFLESTEVLRKAFQSKTGMVKGSVLHFLNNTLFD
jgi:hypothetical protein